MEHLIEFPKNMEGWTHTHSTETEAVYAAPAPARLLLFVPTEIPLNELAGKVIRVNIGYHQDRRFPGKEYTLPEFKGKVHTKVTVRGISDQRAETGLKKIVKDAPQGAERAPGQGDKRDYPNGGKSKTLYLDKGVIQALEEESAATGKSVSEVVNAKLQATKR